MRTTSPAGGQTSGMGLERGYAGLQATSNPISTANPHKHLAARIDCGTRANHTPILENQRFQ